jgi:glycine oxidase
VRVVVVGAGVIGCAVAFECARRGAQVRVVDRRRPGQGATQASAGMLAPYIEGRSAPLLDLTVRGLAEWDPFLATLSESVSTLPDYARNGTVQAAFDEDVAHELEARARLLAAAGVPHRMLCGNDARTLEPALSADVRAALEIPTHGYVSAFELIGALVEGGTRHGASFLQSNVLDVESAGAGVSIVTDAGLLEGDAAVIATGSWTAELARRVDGSAAPPVKPVKGQLIQLRTAAPVVSRVLWGPGCYMVPRRNGSVLVGATAEDAGFDERPTDCGVRALTIAAAALVPATGGAIFEGVRVGLRPATPDELPIIGPSSGLANVHYATGHYRNGVLLSPLTARVVADLVLDGRAGEGLEPLRPARFGL